MTPRIAFIAIFIVTAFSVATAQQGEFIIGAEWLRHAAYLASTDLTPSQDDWARMREAGLHCGHLAVDPRDWLGQPPVIQWTQALLTQANTESMRLSLQYMTLQRMLNWERTRRWRFHPEFNDQFSNDQTTTGIAIVDDIGPHGAERDADAGNPENCRHAIAGTHPDGILCSGMIESGPLYQQFRDNHDVLSVRVRLRLPDAPQGDLLVVHVSVRLDGTEVLGSDIRTQSLKRTPRLPVQPPFGIPLNSNGEYGEVLIGSFTKQTGGNIDYDVIIDWPGDVSVNIDYVAFDTEEADWLFNGSLDQGIDDVIRAFDSYQGLGFYKITDEPRVYQLPTMGYMVERMQYNNAKPAHAFNNIFGIDDRNTPRRYLMESKMSLYIPDIYPFDSGELPENVQMAQVNLSRISASLRAAAEEIRDNFQGVQFLFTPQVHNWHDNNGNDVREPTIREINAEVNIALSNGVKGIWYYLYDGIDRSEIQDPILLDDVNGFVDPSLIPPSRIGLPRTVDAYGENKWAALQALNARLASIGPLLMPLTWRDAISRHELTAPFNRFSLLGGASLDQVESWDGLWVQDNENECFVEIGWLEGTDHHLYVTNRRTQQLADRSITLGFETDACADFTDLESQEIWIIPVDGSFSDTYAPGDGHLLRMREARWSGTKNITATANVLDNAELVIEDNAVVSLQPGSTLIIHANALVTCGAGAVIRLDGGTIVFEDASGTLNLAGGSALQGDGVISGGTVLFRNGFNIASGTRIVFVAGTALAFDCAHPPQYILNAGTLEFADATPFVFDDCLDEIRNYSGGSFITRDGAVLSNLPAFYAWAPSSVTSTGALLMPCSWLFRARAPMDIYSECDAAYTTFGGVNVQGSPAEWDGILVGSESSRISLDHCTIRDIHVDFALSGSGIHFYESPNLENVVSHCAIVRSDNGTLQHGDGIVLQPGAVPYSYARLECTDVYDYWWTGICCVASMAKLTGCSLYGNNVGAGFSLDADASMRKSCVYENAYEGIDVGGLSALNFAPYFFDQQGDNWIVNNDNRQIDVHSGASARCGTFVDAANNHIGHASPSVKRVRIDNASGWFRRNWWAFPPDTLGLTPGWCSFRQMTQQLLFDLDSASFYLDDVWCSEILPVCAPGCDEEQLLAGGNPPQRGIRPLPLAALRWSICGTMPSTATFSRCTVSSASSGGATRRSMRRTGPSRCLRRSNGSTCVSILTACR